MLTLPGVFAHRQLTGILHTHPLYNVIHTRTNLLTRKLGHLSPVYCLLFDKTGHFVFTGSDDGLVKMWSFDIGKLIYTFRGFSSEITDIDVSANNQMLAAGATDRIIRVWSLLSGAPVAVFKQRGIIHSLHFSPVSAPNLPTYLSSTSSDGTVSFFKFTHEDKSVDRDIFDLEPTRFHEKMRPGKSQMIASRFSCGGLFLATGSVDHHVRIYKMDAQDGPVKVLEEAAHLDSVDSICWGHKPLLRFISGSKDGKVRLWSYLRGTWINVELEAEHRRSVRVTSLTWNCDDSRIIAATSDAAICVWDSFTAFRIARLEGHKDEIYVLEPHSCRPEILLSGSHDGKLIIWDISTTEILFQHLNNISGQGHGAVYDAKWSPDSLNIAASDSHGHVLLFGMFKQPYEACPDEMFFNTDYRPLLRDGSNHVVDEQTQRAPHLLPPPFLVDIEGNPYPSDIQKLVPGREHLSDKEALAPNTEDDVGEFQVQRTVNVTSDRGSSHLTESIWRKRELLPAKMYRAAKDCQDVVMEFSEEEMNIFQLESLRKVEPFEQDICQKCESDEDVPPFSTRRLRPNRPKIGTMIELENLSSDAESDASEDSDFSLDRSEGELNSVSSDDLYLASVKNTTRFNEMAASSNLNMNYLKNPNMFADIDAGTPSPSQLKSSFEYPPIPPDTYQQYLQNSPLPNFTQWQQQMIQMQQLGACSNYRQTSHPGEVGRSLLKTGTEDKIPDRVFQDVSNKNNNLVINRGTEEESAAPAAEPVKYECPGCEMFFELKSPSFLIHVRGTHRIRSESDAFKYFMKKHSVQKKDGSNTPPKLMSCGICGQFYEVVDEMKKCLAKHKIDQMQKKKDGGVKKGFAPKQASSQAIVKEILRCDVEGCTDRKGFNSRETLFKHHRKIHNIYKKDTKKRNEENSIYSCIYCPDKCFTTNYNLKRHVLVCKNNPDNQPKELGDSEAKEMGDSETVEVEDSEISSSYQRHAQQQQIQVQQVQKQTQHQQEQNLSSLGLTPAQQQLLTGTSLGSSGSGRDDRGGYGESSLSEQRTSNSSLASVSLQQHSSSERRTSNSSASLSSTQQPKPPRQQPQQLLYTQQVSRSSTPSATNGSHSSTTITSPSTTPQPAPSATPTNGALDPASQTKYQQQLPSAAGTSLSSSGSGRYDDRGGYGESSRFEWRNSNSSLALASLQQHSSSERRISNSSASLSSTQQPKPPHQQPQQPLYTQQESRSSTPSATNGSSTTIPSPSPSTTTRPGTSATPTNGALDDNNEMAPQAGISEEIPLTFSQSSTEGMIII